MPDLRAAMRHAAAAQAAADAQTVIPAPPSHKDPLRIPRWAALLGTGAADSLTTTAALKRPGTREANGLMAGIAKKPVASMATKLGTNALLAFGLDKVHKTNPKLANALALAFSALQAGVAYQNTTKGKK